MHLIGFFGRLCLSIIFIVSGIFKFTDLQMGETILANGLCNLMGYTVSIDWLQQGMEYFLPMAHLLIIAAAVVEVLCGILVLIGLQARLAALILALYLIPTTFIFHHFWYLEGNDRALEMVMFLKNLAIFGGLLLVVAYGTGPKLFAKANPPEKK
jgi:putative oxidoreductase